MVLRGFFDESERPTREAPIGVAGYIFKPTDYKQFARRWKKHVLGSLSGVDHLHMTDLFAGEQDYEGLSVQKRSEVFAVAAKVINDHMTLGVGAAFLQNDFEAMAPAGWATAHGSIYSAACQMCLQLTGAWFDVHRLHDSVSYTFESGHKFQHEAAAVVKGIASVPLYATQAHYATHGFRSKGEACGLEAADILAWAAAKERGFYEGQKIAEPFLRVLSSLAADRTRYEVRLVGREALPVYFSESSQLLVEGKTIQIPVPPRKRTLR